MTKNELEQRIEVLERKIVAMVRSFERIGGMCGTPDTLEACQNILKEVKRILERRRL